jgi:hypothetical protein
MIIRSCSKNVIVSSFCHWGICKGQIFGTKMNIQCSTYRCSMSDFPIDEQHWKNPNHCIREYERWHVPIPRYKYTVATHEGHYQCPCKGIIPRCCRLVSTSAIGLVVHTCSPAKWLPEAFMWQSVSGDALCFQSLRITLQHVQSEREENSLTR